MPLVPIYFDTETTGTRADKDRIIEIAAYDPINERSFCSFINPGISIPPEATAIHKITNEMVADAKSFKEVGEEFIDFCGKDAVLIGHNCDSFDKPFIEHEAKRNDIQLPAFKYIDTLKWSRKYRSDLPRHSLQFLREAFEIEANQAHRALDDVIILHKVFSLMIDDLSIETVLELISMPTVLNRMPFGKHQGKILQEVPKEYVQWLLQSGAFDKPENKDLFTSFEKLGFLSSALK